MKGIRNLFVLAALVSSPAWAIFTNGGFEDGDFTGWTKAWGLNYGLNGSPPFTYTDVVITPGGLDLSAVVGAGTDPRAPQLVLPRVGSYTARINDESPNYHLNLIKQSAPITAADRDPNDGKLHVRFSYAAVLQDPGHPPADQPFFFVILRNVTKGTVLFEEMKYANQSGYAWTITPDPGGADPWASNTAFINQDIIVPDADLGDTLEIETLGADCAYSAHGGYVYLDGFGSAVIPPGPTTTAIPTLSEWALILLSLALGGAVVFGQRRRDRSQV